MYIFTSLLQVSKACTSICLWVRAMHKYHLVSKSVAPKRVSKLQYMYINDSLQYFILVFHVQLDVQCTCIVHVHATCRYSLLCFAVLLCYLLLAVGLFHHCWLMYIYMYFVGQVS